MKTYLRFSSLLISLVLCVKLTHAQTPSLTTISDTVYRANGSPASGSIEITWQAFTTADNHSVAAGELSVTIGNNGAVNLQLAPNEGAQPAGTYYKAIYKLTDGTTSTEYWVVPSVSPTTISAIRVLNAPAQVGGQFGGTSGGTSGGGTVSLAYVNSQLALKANDAAVVHRAGSESVTSVKSFTVSPTVPLPTYATQAANKFYVDSALSAFTPPPPSITAAYTTIDNANNSLTQRATLNFKSGVICADNSTTSTTDCTAAVPSLVTNGLIAQYDFHEGAGTIVHDVSGNANDAAFASCSTPPTWIAGGTTGGVLFASGANTCGINTPSALNAAKTWIIFAYFNNQSTVAFPALLGHTSSTGYAWLFSQSVANYSGQSFSPGKIFSVLWNLGANSFNGATNYSGVSFQMFTLTLTANTSMFINTTQVATLGNTNLPTSGNWILGDAVLGGCNNGPNCIFDGTIYYAAAYNRVLTQAEIQQEYTAMQLLVAQRGINVYAPVNPPAGNTLLFHGDSITAGTNGSNFEQYVTTNTAYNKYALGFPGALVQFNLTPDLSRYFGNMVNPNNPLSTLVVFGGTNDVCQYNLTVASTFNALQQYIRKAKQTWQKVFVATMLDRANCATVKNQYNALIRNGWQASGADSLIDLASDPHLGCDGCNTNATYFADGIHPTDLGYQLIGAYMSNAINAADTTPTQAQPTLVTSGTYTMQPFDWIVRFDTTANNIAVTLPECIGMTGTTRILKHMKDFTGHTLTVQGANSELIDTTANINVASSAAVQLRVVLDAAATGGCHWEQMN